MSPPPVGGFCEDCGHFAGRHRGDRCLWPLRVCGCKGLLWQGRRWSVPEHGEPVLADQQKGSGDEAPASG